MYLTRDEMLGADDCPVEAVEVPEWGGVVLLKAMRLSDLISFQESRKGASNAEVLAWLVARSAVDEGGTLLFSEGDVSRLSEKAAPVMKRLSDHVLKLNRMGKADDERTAKNS